MKDKNPSDLLWLTFTVELLLIIGSAVFYKTVERIPEETRPMSKYEMTYFPKEQRQLNDLQ